MAHRCERDFPTRQLCVAGEATVCTKALQALRLGEAGGRSLLVFAKEHSGQPELFWESRHPVQPQHRTFKLEPRALPHRAGGSPSEARSMVCLSLGEVKYKEALRVSISRSMVPRALCQGASRRSPLMLYAQRCPTPRWRVSWLQPPLKLFMPHHKWSRENS